MNDSTTPPGDSGAIRRHASFMIASCLCLIVAALWCWDARSQTKQPLTDQQKEQIKQAQERLQQAFKLFQEGKRVSQVAAALGIGRPSVYRALEQAGLRA